MDKLKQLVKDLQDKGIPIFLLRDMTTKLPSVTFSLLIVSALMVVLGLIGKFAKLAGGFDIENSLTFFGICFGGYLGRKITNGKTSIEENKEK